MKNREILFLDPVLTHNIWGGTRIGKEFGYKTEGNNIGECWGIAAHEQGDCTIRSGSYEGRKLSELWEMKPKLFGGISGERFPLLVKIIDANTDLSIQVHPDDAYAKLNEEGDLGKAECWYILDCGENASLVIGHNARTKEELEEMVTEKRWKELIREIPIQKGDFLQIDPGTVHAIKGGILLLETQQSSTITYRVYDYDRKDHGRPRELHIQKSLDVIHVPANPAEKSVINTRSFEKNRWNVLIQCRYYRVWKLELEGELEFCMITPFLLMSVIEGAGSVDGIPVKKGDHFILPNGYGDASLAGKMEIIASSVPDSYV